VFWCVFGNLPGKGLRTKSTLTSHNVFRSHAGYGDEWIFTSHKVRTDFAQCRYRLNFYWLRL